MRSGRTSHIGKGTKPQTSAYLPTYSPLQMSVRGLVEVAVDLTEDV